MAKFSDRVRKAIEQSRASEADIVGAVMAAGKKPSPMQTPSDAKRSKRTYSRRDMTAGP